MLPFDRRVEAARSWRNSKLLLDEAGMVVDVMNYIKRQQSPFGYIAEASYSHRSWDLRPDLESDLLSGYATSPAMSRRFYGT